MILRGICLFVLSLSVFILVMVVLEANQDKFGGYPPCMGDGGAVAADAVLVRQNRFLSAVRKRWPRYTAQTSWGATGATPTTGLRGAIWEIYHPVSPAPAFPTAIANLMTTWGDINNLDQAETLVFWLGGLPGIPSVYSTKLVGFSASTTAPFSPLTDNSTTPPTPTGARSPKLFEFDEDRLTDYDNDGWYEYIPDLEVGTSEKAPYVYYDGPTITRTVTAPYTNPPYRKYPAASVSTLPQLGPNTPQWGVAVPYIESFVKTAGSQQLNPVNPKKFQIISAGADGLYGEENNASMRAPVASDGSELLEGDTDNLTNLFPGKIEDARK